MTHACRISEYRFWSPLMGCEASRISAFDERGGEFFMIISAEEGATYRHAKQAAAEAIDLAISLGLPPGEVVLQ
ncbi:MAG: hypothetical protein KGP14_01860 [Betaproteobacteria bacterium]|nr:hypothetical protein [Betaproteobacteria bacterium]